MIVAELDAMEKLTCFGAGGEGFPVEFKKGWGAWAIFSPVARDLDNGRSPAHARHC